MTIEDGHLDIDRGPKDPHEGPDSVEKFSYDYALSESATDRLHDLVAASPAGAEIDRLQRRVVELGSMVRAAVEGLREARADAAEQRKRAEEAEGRLAASIGNTHCTREERDRAYEQIGQERRDHAAAIEKARQEERARIATFLRSDEHGNLEWCNCADSVEKLNNAPTS